MGSRTRATLLPLVVDVEKHVDTNHVPGKIVLGVVPTSVWGIARTMVFSHPFKLFVGWGEDQ